MTIRSLPKALPPQCRTATLRAAAAADQASPLVDVESRRMTLSFATEEPVEMWYGTEIISMDAGAMRVGARQQTMPVLFNHDMGDLLGVCERVYIGADRRAYADIRFGKDTRGEWAMQQVLDLVLVNVSFMYRVFKFVEDTEAETLTAIDWEPYEITLCSVPRDPNPGVGRSADSHTENGVLIETRSAAAAAPAPGAPGALTAPAAHSSPSNQQEQSMNVRFRGHQRPQQQAGTESGGGGGGGSTEGAGAAAAASQSPEARALQVQGAQGERERITEIEALCKRFKLSDELRGDMIRKGATIDQARLTAADEVMKRAAADAKPAADFGGSYNPDLTDKEKARYSMIRAVNAAVSGDWSKAGFELACSNDIARAAARGPSNKMGFFVPTNIPMAMRAPYAVGTPGAGTTGGTLVGTQLLAASFIEVLRNKARVMQMGAQLLTGLSGAVDIPRQTGQTATFWRAEGVDVGEGEATFDKISLNMKTIGTFSQLSRNMLMQSTPDIDMLARADMMASIALGIDLAALSGSGSSGQPLGVGNQSGIGSVIGGTNGAAVTIDHLIDLETQVTNANAPDESLGYIGNAKTVGALKKLKSTTGQYLWTTNPGGQRSGTPGEINGYTVARTNQARSNLTKGSSSGVCSEIFFGAWSELLVGEWGVLEIVANPFAAAVYGSGGVLLRALQSVDIGVRHGASFATMSDALT